MPTYEVDLSDGRTVTLELDSDPTEQDIFDALNVYELVGNSQVEPQSPAMADDRAARKQELAMQQQAIANEGVPEIWKAGAYSHSALARGMQAPKDIIQSATKIGRMLPGYKIARGAADVIGEAVLPDSVNQYRKELVEGFDRQNDEYFTKMAEWENWMAERDAMLGEPGIPTQIAAATARGFAELPTQMLASGTGAAGSLANAAPAIGGQTLAALRGSSIGAGAVSGLQRFAQEKAEGTDDLTALNRAAISGTINGLVTRMFGATGIESIFRSEGPRGVAKKVADVLLQGASEGAEELTAQIVDDITDMMGKNPNMTFGDVVKNALISGVVGSVLGGGVSGLHQTVQPSQRDVAPRQPFNIDELNRTLEENYRGDAAAAQPSVPEISDERGKELQNKFFMSENMSREEVSELESYTEQLSRKSVAGADGLNGVETARLQSLQDRFYTGQDMPGEEVAEMDRLLKKSAFAKDPKTGVSRFVDIINQAIAEEGGEGLFDIDDTGEGSKSNSPRYGNNAWYNEQTGRLVISPEVIAGELMGVPPEKRRAKLKRIINEEIKHKGTKASDAEAFASDATLAERIIATKIYTGSFRGKLHGGGRLTRRNLGYEMIRQRLQKMEGLEITELVGLARTEGWTLKSLDILSDVIARSRQAFNTKASQRQLEILERSADKVARLRKAMVEAGVGGEERKEGAGPASIARLTPDDVINSKRGDLSVGPDEIDSMSDEDLSDLFTRKKEGGAPAYSPQYGSTLWGSMQSEDVVPKLERMRDAAKDRMMAELAKGKDTDMKKFMSEQSKMLWHSGAIEGAKRRGGNFTSAIKTKLGVELTGDPEADNLEFTITDEKSPASGRKFTVERRATVDQIEESKRQIEREVSGETGPASESSLSKEAIDSLGLRYDGGYGRLENYTVTDRNSPASMSQRAIRRMEELRKLNALRKGLETGETEPAVKASSKRLAVEPATPQSLTEGASNALAADVPSFMSFVGMMRSKHGFGVQPGHLAETWADEVWKYLGTASGERLKHLVDKLGLRRQVFGAIKSKGSTVQLTGDIADPSSEESKRTPQQVAAELSIRLIDRADKLQAKADATYLSASKEVSEAATREARLRADGISQKARMLRGQAERIQEAAKTGEGLPMSQEYFLPGMDSPQSSYVQGTEGGGKQRPEIERGKTVTARSRAMAAIGRALLDQIPSEGKSLTRKEIGPEDVRWSQLGSEIYKVTREDLEDLDTLGMQLTQGAGSNAATRRVTAGGRDIETREALPRSATKRVVAFLDNVTGKVFLVSAYRDGRRGPVFLDPGSVTGEHRTLEQLKRYRPLYSIPIDSPVKELRQEFSSFKEFSDKFHRQVQAIARRVGWRGFGTEPDIEATEGFEGEGGVAMGPDADLMRIALGLGEGELESSEQLTEPESRVLYQMFSPVERYEDVQYLMGSLRQRIASRADAARNFERWYQLDDERIRAEEERQTAPSKVAKKLDERIANIKSKMDEIAESGDWRLNPKDQLAMVAISKVLRSVGDEVSGEGMTSGEIADLAIQRIYEAAQRTKTERAFVALSQREFAKGREVPGVAGQQAEWKSPFTRELTMLSRRPPTDTSRAEPGQPMITTSAEKGRPAGLSVEREEKLRLRRSKSEPSNYPGMIPVPLQSIPKDVLKAGTVLDYTKQRRPSKRAVVESGGRVAEPVSYPETGEDINPPATVRYEVSPQKRAQIEREINERIDRIEAKAAREAARPQPASQQEMQLGEGGERNVDLPREPRQQDLGLGPASMRRVAPSSMSEQTHNILTDFGSIYDSWMSDRIREHGGNNARAAANVFDSIIDREKELYGGLSTLLNRARRLAGGIEPSTATSLSGKVREIPGRIKGSAKALAAVNWLNKLEKVTKDAASVRLVNAIESKIENVPAYVRPALDALQGANMEIGRLLQRVVPGFRAGGKFQRNMTSLGYDIIRNGGGDLWNKWVYGTAKANNVPVGDVKRHFAKMKAALDDPATSGAELEQVNQDFARRYPNVITHVKNRFGWHPVIHSEAFGYLENAARRATHITAFREEFQMDKDGRKIFAMLMEALKKELTPEVQDDLDALVRSLNGHPTDDYSSRTLRDMRLGPQQFWGQALRMANATINGLMAKAVLTLQPVTQTGELLFGSTPVFLGMRQYLRAAMRAKELYRIMEITGSVNRVMSDYTFNRNAPIRSLFRSSGNVLSKVFANNALNELQEALAATTARITAEDISTGNLSDWQKQMLPDTLRKMGFDKRHVAGIMKGDPQMLAMFIRRAPAWLTAGNRSGAESGRLGSSRMFNSVFRFQSYPMMKANQSRKVLVDFVDAWSGHSGPGTKKAATKSLARFVAGNAMQGAVTAMLASLAYNGLMGLRIKEEEIKDEPFKFLFDSFLASTSGPAYMLYRGMSESGLGGIGKQASKVVFPYAISKELYDMSTGAEKYKDLSVGDRIGKFLQSKTPGTRLLAAGAAMAGLSNEDRELDAAMSALFRWKSSELGFTDNDRHLKKDERAKFRKHIRRAVEAMKEGDSSAFTSEWMSAVGETSTDAVSQSLSARKVLKGPNGRELTEDEKSSLRRRIGMEAYNKLEYYDLMLEFAADGVMLPRPSR